MSGSSGGGQQASAPQATPQQLADAYISNLPSILNVTNAQANPTAQALASAATGVNPLYTQSGLNQLNQFAGGYQGAGNNLATNQSNFTADLLGGAGARAAIGANNLSNTLNPAQRASNTQAANLVNSINLNGLSGGEQAAAERSLNQSNYATGNLGLDNATNAVSNAMNFGNALQAKRAALGSALGAAQGVASNQNQFVNPVGTALGSGNVSSNFGLGTFNPTQGANAGNAALNFGSGVFGGQASNASAQRSFGGSSNTSGALCCFIFLESYNGTLPESVRRCRDYYYLTQPEVARGYKSMAKWLVPLMKKYSIVRSLVNLVMVKPITAYGEWLVGNSEIKGGEMSKKFWFFIWKQLGR